MTEGITAEGLIVKDYNTLVSDIQADLNAIYAQDGDEINFDSETPDGQATNIYAQGGADVRELAQGVYNSFDPDKCDGAVQDSRYALNYLTRNGGTFTIQNIDVTVDKTVNLEGLDSNYNNADAAAYTVSNDAGNLWYLIDSIELEAGTHSLPFRYQNYGLIQPTLGTIINQVTKVLGVVSVINSVAPTTLGNSQESDISFRIRRERSTAKRGQNNLDALLGELLDLDGVSDARTWVNQTSETDETGTAPWTVWIVIEGGANSDIASLIYEYSCGLPTRGEVEVDVPSVSGQIFKTKFDRANPVPLYIKFDFWATVDLSAVDFDSIKADLAQNLSYSLDEAAETSKITEAASQAILSNGGGGYALNVEVSTDGTTYTDYIPSASMQNKFVVDPTRIAITATGNTTSGN